MNAINEEPEPPEIEALLPWYAAGKLSRRDANRVERALADDRELARQYDLVREELVETIYLNETLGAPSIAGLGAGSKFSGSRPDEFGLTKVRSTQAHSGL